mmetsp:Transcript_13957/g.43955  ORF Transcript_13957/g.43955 Transcript_13957/m.43955 type:complete len:244 (-) Transcript_13957:612-1343(-)
MHKRQKEDLAQPGLEPFSPGRRATCRLLHLPYSQQRTAATATPSTSSPPNLRKFSHFTPTLRPLCLRCPCSGYHRQRSLGCIRARRTGTRAALRSGCGRMATRLTLGRRYSVALPPWTAVPVARASDATRGWYMPLPTLLARQSRRCPTCVNVGATTPTRTPTPSSVLTVPSTTSPRCSVLEVSTLLLQPLPSATLQRTGVSFRLATRHRRTRRSSCRQHWPCACWLRTACRPPTLPRSQLTL